MSGAAGHLDTADRAEPARWAGCLLLVLALHAAAALFLLERAPEIGVASPPEAVMLDLAPEPVAPEPIDGGELVPIEDDEPTSGDMEALDSMLRRLDRLALPPPGDPQP